MHVVVVVDLLLISGVECVSCTGASKCSMSECSIVTLDADEEVPPTNVIVW